MIFQAILPTAKGAIIGAVIGFTILVFDGEFKGNLGEPEFLASYVGGLTPATALGAVYGALVGWQKQRRQISKPQPQKSKAFGPVVVMLSLIAAGKVAIDFPNGEGLIHPTHAANVAEGHKVCLKQLAADTTDSPDVKEAYCSCWADQMAHAAETASPSLAQLQQLSQKLDTVCRQQISTSTPQ